MTIRLGGAANVAHNIVALGGRVVAGRPGRRATRRRRRCATRSSAAGIGADGLVADAARPTTAKCASSPTATSRSRASTTRRTTTRPATSRRARRARVERWPPERWRDCRLRLPEGRRHAAGWCATLADLRASAAVSRCWSIRRSRTSVATPARRWSRRTITRPKSRRTCASAPTRTRRAAARRFATRARCAACSITRGEHGMWLLDDRTEGALPAAAREVADVTGAGDTVIATLALALAAGATCRSRRARQPRRRHRRRQVRPGDALGQRTGRRCSLKGAS